MRLLGANPNPEELVGGFPKTREELFAYRGLILGSVEAGAFTGDQLQMIADFVDRRGGGLLMLGGARSFGEGGYGGTPVADALPLLIDPRTRASDPAPLVRLKVSADPRRTGARGDADRRLRSGVGRALARTAAGDDHQRAARREAGRHGAAERHRRARPRAGRAGVAAVRPRQGDRVDRCRTRGSGRCTRRFRSRIRRTSTTGGRCCAGSSTACPTWSMCASDRSRRARRRRHDRSHGRRQAVRRAERRHRCRAGRRGPAARR